MNELDQLPIAETRESFWWTETWLNGKLIDRRHLFETWRRGFVLGVHTLWMRAKGKVGFWLLQGFGDPCPHCKKMIDIGNWKNPFEPPPPNLKAVQALAATRQGEENGD